MAPAPKLHLTLKYLIYPLLVIVLYQFSNAQVQENDMAILKADQLYEQHKIEKALKNYLRIITKQGFSEWTYLQTGRCYEMLNSYADAESYFDQLFYKSNNIDPAVFLEYGRLLMKLDKRDEARSYFTSYNNLIEEGDLTALRYIESIEDYDKYFLDSSFFQFSQLDIADKGNILSPLIYEDKLFYLSNEKNAGKEPLIYNIYTSTLDDSKREVHFSGKAIEDQQFEGIAIAQSTGEFIYSIFHAQTNKSELFRAFINEEGDRISKPERLSVGSFQDRLAFPALSKNGEKLIFASNSPSGTGGWDLYISERTGYGYAEPKLIPGFINTLGDEIYPSLVNDSILFFVSNGHGGVGGLDIFYINLNTPTALPKNVGYPVNSIFDDKGLCVSSNGKIGFVVSERGSANNTSRLYEFKLEKIRSWGEITDKTTGDNLKNVAIDITPEGETSSQFSLADNGRFSVEGAPGDNYSISVWKEGYELDKFYVSTEDASIMGLYEVDLGKFPILKSDEPASVPVAEPIATVVVPKIIDEPESIIVPPKRMASPIKFRLQIAASRVPLSKEEQQAIYSGDRVISEFTEDNWFKYYIGEFDSYFEANTERKKSGVKNAFIAAYEEETKLKLISAIDKVHTRHFEPLKQPIPKQNYSVVKNYTIYYSPDSYQPRAEDTDKLRLLLEELKTDPQLLVEITGHTDITGSPVYNMSLANERANYVKAYLVIKGIDQSRIYLDAYGETRVVKSCGEDCTHADHLENRRVEVVIYK